MKKRERKKHGEWESAFTLIELLIVVAIIGILAAIAVPNFVNAQARSKVARAQADMRSLATALETYRVDSNTYPPDGDDREGAPNFDAALLLRVLTTPISYINNLPEDPFHPYNHEFDPESGVSQAMSMLFPGNPPYTYPYNTFGSYNGNPSYGMPANKGKPDNFGLSSLGPNQIFNAFVGFPIQYDPSNGTISDGDITIFGGARTPLTP